jgi:hypothetical protein
MYVEYWTAFLRTYSTLPTFDHDSRVLLLSPAATMPAAAPDVHLLFHQPIADHSFSADRSQLAVARDSRVQLYGRTASGGFVLQDELAGHDKTVTSVDIAPMSGKIVTCSQGMPPCAMEMGVAVAVAVEMERMAKVEGGARSQRSGVGAVADGLEAHAGAAAHQPGGDGSALVAGREQVCGRVGRARDRGVLL